MGEATIKLKDPADKAPKGLDELKFQFNPTQLQISKSSQWNRTTTRGAKSAPKAEFIGTNPHSLQMELLIDARGSVAKGGTHKAKRDVVKEVETLLAWTNPSKRSIDANKPNPPIVTFQWGAKTYFEAFLKSVSARYTLFSSKGKPLRASVSISLEEVPVELGPPNPSSGGVAGRRRHVVRAGDTLHSIAHVEYGSPALWRGLASANEIDDPLRLAPGRVVQIPPEAEARQLS